MKPLLKILEKLPKTNNIQLLIILQRNPPAQKYRDCLLYKYPTKHWHYIILIDQLSDNKYRTTGIRGHQNKTEVYDIIKTFGRYIGALRLALKLYHKKAHRNPDSPRYYKSIYEQFKHNSIQREWEYWKEQEPCKVPFIRSSALFLPDNKFDRIELE